MSPPPGDLAALREATLEQARAALAEAVTPDRGLLQGVRALDEALEAENRLAERLARWAAEAAGAARQPPAAELPPDAPEPLRELQVAWR
ncbi:MAG: hypothetical protein MK222_02180, partial [Candidatus Poseidoniia archaeon]|nr:hypothetical protein [Candidatus Poseidoniia archaeon]